MWEEEADHLNDGMARAELLEEGGRVNGQNGG